MAVCFTSWTVLPHRPIERLADNLWRVEGKLGNNRRTMSLIRLNDGRVLVHNAIALDEAEMAEIDAWGEVAGILVPNSFHRMDCRIMQERYPKAKVYCPKKAMRAVGKATAVHGDYGAAPRDQSVTVRHINGVNGNEGVVEVATERGMVVVFNDMMMNMPPLGFPLNFLLGPTGRMSVPRFARWFWLRDKTAMREELDRFADLGVVRVIPGHGEDVTDRIGDRFRACRDLL